MDKNVERELERDRDYFLSSERVNRASARFLEALKEKRRLERLRPVRTKKPVSLVKHKNKGSLTPYQKLKR